MLVSQRCYCQNLSVFALLISLFALYPIVNAKALTPDEMLETSVRIRYTLSREGDLITGHGTAFGVNLEKYGFEGNNYLLSAAHNVLDNAGNAYRTIRIEIRYPQGVVWSDCRVVAADAEMDLCLLQSQHDLPRLASLDLEDARPGIKVVMPGSPRGTPVANYEGVLTQRFYMARLRSMMQIPFDHGDSGAPVFDANNGKVIGVAVAGIPLKNGIMDKSIGLFAPVTAIESFLEPFRPRTFKPKQEVASAVFFTPQPQAQQKANTAVAATTTPLITRPVEQPAVAKVEVAKAEPAPTPVTSSAPLQQIQDYTIQNGDTLWSISKRYNVELALLFKQNPEVTPTSLKIGQVIRIPR